MSAQITFLLTTQWLLISLRVKIRVLTVTARSPPPSCPLSLPFSCSSLLCLCGCSCNTLACSLRACAWLLPSLPACPCSSVTFSWGLPGHLCPMSHYTSVPFLHYFIFFLFSMFSGSMRAKKIVPVLFIAVSSALNRASILYAPSKCLLNERRELSFTKAMLDSVTHYVILILKPTLIPRKINSSRQENWYLPIYLNLNVLRS